MELLLQLQWMWRHLEEYRSTGRSVENEAGWKQELQQQLLLHQDLQAPYLKWPHSTENRGEHYRGVLWGWDNRVEKKKKMMTTMMMTMMMMTIGTVAWN